MMKSEKEMIYFEEVDRIKVFRGVNKQLVLGRGINRNIMEFKDWVRIRGINTIHISSETDR